MRKVVMWALVLAVLCTSFGFAQTTYPLAGGKKFTYWCSLPANVTSYAKNNIDVPFRQNLEKRTGVKIEYLHPVAGSELEQLNMMIASGDFPDMAEYTWPSYSGGTAKLYADGVILKLNDVVDKWMPNLKAFYTKKPNIAKQVKSDDGGFYLVPFIRDSDELRFTSGPTLRADWLAADRLDVPETIGEWEAVLTAFKTKNGAEAPFTGSMTDLQRVFIQAFDIASPNYFYPLGATVKYSPLEPGFKDFVSKMADWYAKGLIDKNLMTVDRKYVDAAMTNGKAGAGYCAGGGQVGPYITTGKKALPTFDLVAGKFAVQKLGQKVKFINSFEFTSNGHVVISKKVKDVEGAAKWLDYAYGDEGNLFFNFGIEGESFTYVSGVPTYSDLVMKDAKLSIAQAMSKYSVAPLSGPFVQALGYIQQYYTMPQQKNALKMWSTKDSAYTVLPPVTFTPAESKEVAGIMADITTYVDEMRAKFILGTEPLANLDKFQATVKSMGVEKALKIYQAALDRYNER